MGDKTRGLYNKFRVSRTDGTSRKGKKHYECRYFVLDVDHDPHMVPAMIAYAQSASRDGYNLLASDIVGQVMKSPAYAEWHALKFKQLPARLKRFLAEFARTEMDMNRA